MPFQFSMAEETICDHKVTAQTKKIWAIELEMLDKFAEVCERHHLKWFVSGGTLIGAVRHQGYIPWDDDIDIHMLADDYEKFCQVASEELQPFFWQEGRSEEGAPPWHGKIRNSQTTGCTQWEYENFTPDMNHGIFIDVFPLSYIPADKKVHQKQIKRLLRIAHCIGIFHWHRRRQMHPQDTPASFRHAIEYFFLHLFTSYRSLCEKYLETCNLQKEPTEFVGATSFGCTIERFIWPANNYREMVDLPFMGGTVKGPIEWDACLRRQYGDYMVIKKGGALHTDITFDTETPYAVKFANGKTFPHQP